MPTYIEILLFVVVVLLAAEIPEHHDRLVSAEARSQATNPGVVLRDEADIVDVTAPCTAAFNEGGSLSVFVPPGIPGFDKIRGGVVAWFHVPHAKLSWNAKFTFGYSGVGGLSTLVFMSGRSLLDELSPYLDPTLDSEQSLQLRVQVDDSQFNYNLRLSNAK